MCKLRVARPANDIHSAPTIVFVYILGRRNRGIFHAGMYILCIGNIWHIGWTHTGRVLDDSVGGGGHRELYGVQFWFKHAGAWRDDMAIAAAERWQHKYFRNTMRTRGHLHKYEFNIATDSGASAVVIKRDRAIAGSFDFD